GARRDDRRLRVEEVVLRLDLEEVRAAADQAEHLLLALRRELLEAHDRRVERRDLRRRPHGARDEARLAVPARELVGDLARVSRRALVDLDDAVAQVEVEESVVRVERVRLDDVGARLEEAPVDPLDRGGVRDVERLGAVGDAPVLHRDPEVEDRLPHRAVEEDDALLRELHEPARALRDRAVVRVERPAGRWRLGGELGRGHARILTSLERSVRPSTRSARSLRALAERHALCTPPKRAMSEAASSEIRDVIRKSAPKTTLARLAQRGVERVRFLEMETLESLFERALENALQRSLARL